MKISKKVMEKEFKDILSKRPIHIMYGCHEIELRCDEKGYNDGLNFEIFVLKDKIEISGIRQ